MDSLRIACATDEAYVPYCAAMLQGLLAQHPEGLTVHLLHTGLPPAQLGLLASLLERGRGRLQPVLLDPARVRDLPRMARIPPLMWGRVLLPELIADAERVLYLDVDTLALQPLTDLWRTEFADDLVAAVDNVLHPGLLSRPAELGLPSGARYFNSGVLLMNLEAMRREGTSAKVLERARAGGLLWPDQDALNVVLAGRRKTLHPRWNCQNSFFYWTERSRDVLGPAALEEALRAPALLHFEGPSWAKPWHFLSDHPYRGAWRAAQRAAGVSLPRSSHPLKRVLSYLPAPVIGMLRSLFAYPRPQRR